MEYPGNREDVGDVVLTIVQFDRAPEIDANIVVNFMTMDGNASGS